MFLCFKKNSLDLLWKNSAAAAIVKLLRIASSNPAPILTVSSSTGLPSFLSLIILCIIILSSTHTSIQSDKNWPPVSFGIPAGAVLLICPKEERCDYGQKVWIWKVLEGWDAGWPHPTSFPFKKTMYIWESLGNYCRYLYHHNLPSSKCYYDIRPAVAQKHFGKIAQPPTPS